MRAKHSMNSQSSIDFVACFQGFSSVMNSAGNYRPERLFTCFDNEQLYMLTLTSVMPNAEVSDGGPLTHDKPAAQSRRSLH